MFNVLQPRNQACGIPTTFSVSLYQQLHQLLIPTTTRLTLRVYFFIEFKIIKFCHFKQCLCVSQCMDWAVSRQFLSQG